jgi:ribonucleoside-diphosphate reductase alpha chain
MKIERRFTTPSADVYSTDIEWTHRNSRITNADGSVVFETKDAEVPDSWSQLATDIMVSKYFRKAGVPRLAPDGRPETDENGDVISGPESSVRQIVHRLAGCWRSWGERHGYFDTPADAQAFYDEIAHMMLHQMAAPNSPQWFNTGLSWAYSISGPPQGHWITDPATGEQRLAEDAYSHPQPHACFIQSISDDLVNEGGIMDLWVREARLFKYGSGTGTNFSSLRAENEPLSGGGKSSGLMSFLKIGDRAAGAIKSGGTTRRAAKMVCLDADHPDIEAFVSWKVREELKVAALVEGLKHLDDDQKAAAERLGLELDYDFNGEAYFTVSGQNSNNSVRLTDAFFRAVADDGDWALTARTDGAVVRTIKARELWSQICFAAWRSADPGVQFDSTINSWHTCPESGRINASNPCSEYMFLDDTACNLASINLMKFYDAESRRFDVEAFEHAIDLWTMVLEISVLMASFPSEEIARQSDRFRTLGLGFANLGAMLMQAGIPYDSDEGRAICSAVSAVLTGRSYVTSARMAERLGPFSGFDENRDAMLRVIRNHRRAAHGVARASGEYEELPISPVPIDHGLFRRGAIRLNGADDLLARATGAWDEALALGERHGFRNAQTTVIAPTGTIGLLMDCDTTGVEPDFALVKFKKLAGGGYFKIANASLRPALTALGYSGEQSDEILTYVMGTLSLDVPLDGTDPRAEGEGSEAVGLAPDVSDGVGDPDDAAAKEGAAPSAPRTFRDYLVAKGFTPDELVAIENELPTVFELGFAFTAWSIPDRVLEECGVDPEAARNAPAFNGLEALGLQADAVDELNRTICGTQTVEGAPHIRKEHLAVFDCASRCGTIGTRFIAAEGHIRMMAAAQPFITGAISKTINLPAEANVEDIASAYWLSWELGLKANALYRDGSKLSQPLNARTEAQASEQAARDVEDDAADDPLEMEEAVTEIASDVAAAASAVGDAPAEPNYIERVVERIIERPMRRRLPDTRSSLTHRFNVAGHEGYLTVGLYANGSPGELFITMSKEGSTIGGLMDSLGTAISVALQYGVPIESLVNKFAHQRFEPMGMTANRDVPFAKSLVDYIFRWMGMEFIPGYREANAPPRPKPAPDPVPSSAGTTEKRSSDAPAGDPVASTVMEDNRWSESESGNGSGPTPSAASVDASRPAPNGSADAPGVRVVSSERARTGVASAPVSGRISEVVKETAATSESMTVATPVALGARVLDRSHAAMQSDAPACDVCGAITVRNGTCYKCLNCGNSMGCS